MKGVSFLLVSQIVWFDATLYIYVLPLLRTLIFIQHTTNKQYMYIVYTELLIIN